jgi:hypothetical protein
MRSVLKSITTGDEVSRLNRGIIEVYPFPKVCLGSNRSANAIRDFGQVLADVMIHSVQTIDSPLLLATNRPWSYMVRATSITKWFPTMVDYLDQE